MFTYYESIVTPTFREAVLSHYPLTARSAPSLRLLDYILFGSAIDKDERLLMLPYELCLQFRNGTRPTKNYNSSDLLNKFNADCFKVGVRNHSAIAGKVRLITDAHIPDWLIKARRDMLLSPASERTIFLVSGKTACLKAETARARKNSLGCAPIAKSEMACTVLDYLNGLDESIFASLPNKMPAAMSKVEGLHGGTRASQSALLAGIHGCPKPFYKPVTRSARLYTSGPTFLNLKSSIRDTFTDEWIKLDLRQAQFAIISKLWEVEGLRSLLDTLSGSLWSELMKRANIPASPDAKGAVKEAVYATIYGSSAHNVKSRLQKELGGAASERFMNLSVMQLIFVKREERYKKLYSELTTTDAYKNRLEMQDGLNKWQRRRDAMSILAQQAQSYELPILYPLIEYSKQTEGTSDPFTVTAWLHDGVWAKCSQESAPGHLEKVANLVKESADQLLGCEMQLDIETPWSD